MSIFIVDIEADGPIPGIYSMVSFGAVKVDSELKTHFKGEVYPITDNFNLDNLNACNMTREKHLSFKDPKIVMTEFFNWINLNSKGKPIFMSDNPCFDWQFINYYFHVYMGKNPFGFTGRRIGDLYSGLKKEFRPNTSWRNLAVTEHTHDPLDDAIGHAEALVSFCKEYNLKIPMK